MYIAISEFSNVLECVFHSTRKFQKITYKQNEFYGGFIMVKYEERNGNLI